jgi:hypothetical protein
MLATLEPLNLEITCNDPVEEPMSPPKDHDLAKADDQNSVETEIIQVTKFN